jgi:hypothetical protein
MFEDSAQNRRSQRGSESCAWRRPGAAISLCGDLLASPAAHDFITGNFFDSRFNEYIYSRLRSWSRIVFASFPRTEAMAQGFSFSEGSGRIFQRMISE